MVATNLAAVMNRTVKDDLLDAALAQCERLRKAATDFLLEQTDENAAKLADALGWVRRS